MVGTRKAVLVVLVLVLAVVVVVGRWGGGVLVVGRGGQHRRTLNDIKRHYFIKP